ncbi:unnamed protein product, partial [Meganyctiphanes norvegica]
MANAEDQNQRTAVENIYVTAPDDYVRTQRRVSDRTRSRTLDNGLISPLEIRSTFISQPSASTHSSNGESNMSISSYEQSQEPQDSEYLLPSQLMSRSFSGEGSPSRSGLFPRRPSNCLGRLASSPSSIDHFAQTSNLIKQRSADSCGGWVNQSSFDTLSPRILTKKLSFDSQSTSGIISKKLSFESDTSYSSLWNDQILDDEQMGPRSLGMRIEQTSLDEDRIEPMSPQHRFGITDQRSTDEEMNQFGARSRHGMIISHGINRSASFGHEDKRRPGRLSSQATFNRQSNEFLNIERNPRDRRMTVQHIYGGTHTQS